MINVHKQVVNQSEEYKFNCHLCDYKANDTRKIDAHGLIEHGVLSCEKCDYRAEDRDLIRKHMETHTGHSILPCEICEFKTTKKSTLDEHIDSKHKRKKNVVTLTEEYFFVTNVKRNSMGMLH